MPGFAAGGAGRGPLGIIAENGSESESAGVSESKGDEEPVLLVGAPLADQGAMSITKRGTLNGTSIIIKQISPEQMAENELVEWETKNGQHPLRQKVKDAQMLMKWSELKNEINISTKLRNQLGACSPDSDIICYLGYAANSSYVPIDIEEPLIRREDIPTNTIWIFYRDVGGNELFNTILAEPSSPLYKDPGDRIAILTKLLRAIKKLHDVDIVHLDIKPENIILTPAGNPVLIDLGFACSVDAGRPYSCSPIALKGTPGYEAPEMLRPMRKALPDIKKADIFSLGVTIYATLTKTMLEITDTSRPPKVYSDPAKLLSTPPPQGGGFPDAIRKLVNSMVEINPASRPTIETALAEWKAAIGDTSSEPGNEKIRIAFVRHAISCSNALRMRHSRFNAGNYLTSLSQKIKDPQLSEKGEQLATAYSPAIQETLQGKGFDPATTTYAASSLRRAQQTLRLLFAPRAPYILPHLKETGDVLENQPTEPSGLPGFTDKRPRAAASAASAESTLQDHGDWRAFTTWLKANLADPIFTRDRNGDINVVIVGHGSYLREVYTGLNKMRQRAIYMNNMDYFIVESPIRGAALNFRLVGTMIPAPAVSDDDVRTNKCPVSGVEYPPLPESPLIMPEMRAALNKLNVDFLTGLGIPASIPLYALIQQFGNSYTLYDDLEPYNSDVTIRTLFIKLYDSVKRMKQWPPPGYAGPPTYLIPGYVIEPANHFSIRILTAIGERTNRTAKQVYDELKNTEEKNQGTKINELLGIKADVNRFPPHVIRTGEMEGSMILFDKDPAYDRFLPVIRNYDNYNEYLLYLARISTATEYQDNFYASDLILTKLDQKLADYNAQFFTIIDKTKSTDHFVQGTVFDITRVEGKPVMTLFATTTAGVMGSLQNPLQKETPPLKYVKDTTYMKFKYEFMPSAHSDSYVGVIQGFKLHEYPDIAAALFLGPPIDMSDHARKLLGAAWRSAEKTRAWILEKTGLTEAQFREKYALLLQNFERQDTERGATVTPAMTNTLNMLEARSRISPRTVCGEILKKATAGDETARQLKEKLGAQIKTGIFSNTCPTKEQFQAAFNQVRSAQGLYKMTFIDDVVALRDIAQTKLEKSEDLYDEFKQWLLAYNNTKRTANTSLFIPQIIEISSSIKSPLVSSTPLTVGSWRSDFVAKLGQIIELLQGDLPARLSTKVAENRNIRAIEARPVGVDEKNAALKARFPAPAPNSATPTQQAVMNLPYNLDVVANLNEIDPKLAVQEVQNAPFQTKYVKNPNPAGIQVLDELKKRTKKGWFSTTYPSKQNIQGILTSVRSEYGLPPDTIERKKGLERILRFAKSPRATKEQIYKKIFAYKETHPGILEDIKATYSGWTRTTSPPEKKAMIDALDNIVNSRGAAGVGAYVDSAPRRQPTLALPQIEEPVNANILGGAAVGPPPLSTDQPQLSSANIGPLPDMLPLQYDYEYTGEFPAPSPPGRKNSFRDDYYDMAGGRRYKTAAPTRKMKQQKNQRGGGVTMPLGFYQDGAQMNGTHGSETGVGLGVMTANMARSALVQTGGKKKVTRKQQKQKQQRQRGGFAPSVMGSFASNGLSLLPVASFMGYRMMNKGNKTRKGKTGRTGKKRLTRRH